MVDVETIAAPRQHQRFAVGLACAFSVLALVSSAALAGWLPLACATWCGIPVVFLGAGYPLMMRWSPVEPSALKLALCASLLSPGVLAVFYLGFRAADVGDAAYSWTMALVAPLQLLTPRKSIRCERLGRAAELTILAGALAAVGLVWLLFLRGNGPRFLHAGAFWHIGVAQAVARGWPLEHPWLAGTGLRTHPGYAYVGSLLGRVLAIGPARAFASLQVFALFWMPCALYLLAAPLWHEARRISVGVALAFFGWNALGGLAAILGGSAAAASDAALETWSGALAGATFSAPGQVWYGLAAWFQIGPWAPAATLAVTAWMAGAHGLRHGRRPWVGLCALLHGLALACDPPTGAAAIGASLACALVHPGQSALRPVVASAILAAALPGWFLVRTFGWSAAPPASLAGSAGAGLTESWLRSALLPAALMGLASLGLCSSRLLGTGGEDDRRAHRTVLVLLVSATSVALLGARIPHDDPWALPGMLRLASLPLGLLAGAGLVELFAARGWRRVAGSVLALALVVGATASSRVAFAAHLAWQPATVPIAESPAGLSFVPGVGRGREESIAAVYAWLRDNDELRALRPLLVRSFAAADERRGAGFPHAAALLTDLPMWVDQSTGQGLERFEPRHERIRKLYSERTDWDPNVMGELRALARAALFVVEEEDRKATHRGDFERPYRGIDLRLLRLGCERVHEVGSVAVYLWMPTSQ